ncbi:flagellar motor protein MotB [Ammoniphilus resinae]|uniref:Chemotaxis protein MotB n=1 Tax=Ammoniphilus resinae TaxID=861532 RepID=A0ABS4GMH7_9BACL|nr:flagellar motor protein MotB [Ammoniphilus resinae]MBP1931449.1 chemotaxis protein MotB [Ammoniphilus resinae]
MRRRRREEQHDEGSERWLITYADMITLLMVFFIVLYSMSNIEKEKADSLIESMYNAFNHVSVFDTTSGGKEPTTEKMSMEAPVPSTMPTKPSPSEAALQGLKQKLQEYVNEHDLNLVIDLTENPKGVQLTLKDVILFDLGQANLKPDFLHTLDDIIGLLSVVDNPINIEGHTDNRPIRSGQFPSNWELSSARALAVLHHFEKKGISPERLQFTGYGEYHPVYPNDTAEHRQANRRVNIVILRK